MPGYAGLPSSPWHDRAKQIAPRGTGLSMVDHGLVPEGFLHSELYDLIVHAWDDFLAANADPHLSALADVDGDKIYPHG
ncbi:hypothetical protein [Rhodococcus wratislaviensis]|uniref:Uncharacterized protein n=1 Tax=Rhodococcus wratislaviensis NBRC 100605 TaxID=1219028 RepID=X0PVA9_RHOWR|nr:hypothetical protein [Rhodococcus wratislaviensis]GAF47138.1 hypothetical protein RW1_038_00590 [Rhodococcus wratislaviensis NBRC 100605]